MFRPNKPGADGQAKKPPSEDKAALSEGKRLERCLEDCRAAGDEKAALSYRNRVCAHYKRLLVERPLACWEAQIDIRLWRAVFYRRLKELQGEKKASGGKFPPSSTQQRVVDFVREGTTFYKEILEELLWASALMEGKQSNRCFRQPSDPAKDGGSGGSGGKPAASTKPRAPANAATALRALCAQAQARVGDLLRHRAALCSPDVVRDEEESAALAAAAAATAAANAQEEAEAEEEVRGGGGSARAVPQVCVAESARDWYLKAHRTLPEGGHPHNQLAVLAFGSTAPEATLEAVLRLYLALACDEPFTSARENLVKFYGTVLGGERRPPADPSGHRVAALQRPWHATIKERPAAGTHETTVASVMARLAPHLLHLHAMAFTGIGLERHAPTADLVGGLYRVLLSSTAFHQDPELLVNLMALNIFLVRNATYQPPGCQPDERHGMRVAATRRLAFETCFTLWAVMVDVLREEAVFEPASYVFLTWLAGYDEPPPAAAGGDNDGDGGGERARPLLLTSLIAAVGAEELLPRLAFVLRACETYYAAEGAQSATEEWAPEEISLEGFTHVPLLRRRPPPRGGNGGGGEDEEEAVTPEASPDDEEEEGLQRAPRVAAQDCGALLARRLLRLQPLVFELLRVPLLAREGDGGALTSLVEPVAVPSFAVALPSMKAQAQQPAAAAAVAAAGVAPTGRAAAGAGRGRGGPVAGAPPLQPRGGSPPQAPAAGEPASPSAAAAVAAAGQGGAGTSDAPVVKVVHKKVSAAAAAAAQSDAAAEAVAATWSHNGPGLTRAPTDMTVSTEDDEEIVLKPGAFVGTAAQQGTEPLDGILGGLLGGVTGLEPGESWDTASTATSTASKITLAQSQVRHLLPQGLVSHLQGAPALAGTSRDVEDSTEHWLRAQDAVDLPPPPPTTMPPPPTTLPHTGGSTLSPELTLFHVPPPTAPTVRDAAAATSLAPGTADFYPHGAPYPSQQPAYAQQQELAALQYMQLLQYHAVATAAQAVHNVTHQ